MKQTLVLLSTLIILTCSCGTSHPDASDSAGADSVIPSNSAAALPNILLMYGMTKDKSFCDVKQFLPGDCGGGMFYFTEKGNVVREDWCYGTDTSSFAIGTYSMSSGKIICEFDQDYSYFNGYNDDEEELPYDPNSGKLVQLKEPQTIHLEELACENYKYGFHSSDGESSFVLFVADTAQSGPFKRLCKRINAFSEL